MNTSPLRLAAIGCGRVFERYHLPAIRALESGASGGVRVQLVGACEPDETRRNWVSSILGLSCADNMEELLQMAEPEAVLVSAPPPSHASIAERLLRRGVHVLVEKPMAITLDEAEVLLAAQRESGRVLRVGFNRRYRDDYRRLRPLAQKMKESGMLRVSFSFVSDAARWNPASDGADPEFVLHDAGSHALDIAAHVADAPVIRVRARVSDEDRDRIVTIEAGLDGGSSAVCTVGQGRRYREQLIVSGHGRRLRADVSGHTLASRLAIRARLVHRKLTRTPTPTGDSFLAQWAAFSAACRGLDDGIGAGASDGFASVSAVGACLSSIAAGGEWRPVPQPHSTRATA